MSDRGRSRRTARSTKATAPKATPDTEVEPGDEPAATAGAESDKTPSGAAAAAETPAEDTTGADETVSLDKPGDAEDTAADTAEDTAQDAADASADADAEDAADASDADADPDATADDDAEDDAEDGKAASGKTASRSKAPTPMTKAEKRAAARIAAAKAARRRRTGQAIVGTIIVLLVVGGAFAGVWYFGDRAEKNRVKCKPAAEAAFPPLLGGMNKGLATEPTITASSDEIKTVRSTILIKGECKAVKAGQTVSVNYVGATMKDGKVFDASWPRKKTIEIPVGQKQLGKQPQVIEGWDEGLVGLKIGTRVQLDIPGNKAYGDDAPEGYPKGTLRFIVDILDAKDADSSGLPAGLGG
ncbi:FKBP-type peptidyl-prolyl cis-trans isomerase [Dactylosporangium sp. NPDC049525]|uniref:FKBP-type peptidyl-prolyl cis-trans isomerase n=1 Tax=Dactylosporangium sp. NPDC049525 TaxID=3154730 RepID=UPI003412E274